MEKEKILSTFHDKLGKTNLSDRTIETYIDCTPLAEGQEPDEAYWNNGLRMLQALDGQFNHDVAAQVEDFKKNYKPETNNTTPPTSPQPNNSGENKNDEVAELRKKIDELTGQIGETKKKEERERLLKDVRAEMQSQKATDEYVLDKTLEGAELDPAKSVKDLAAELLKKYDTEYKACRGVGATPRTAGGNTGSQGAQTAAADYFARKAKREGWKTN